MTNFRIHAGSTCFKNLYIRHYHLHLDTRTPQKQNLETAT